MSYYWQAPSNIPLFPEQTQFPFSFNTHNCYITKRIQFLIDLFTSGKHFCIYWKLQWRKSIIWCTLSVRILECIITTRITKLQDHSIVGGSLHTEVHIIRDSDIMYRFLGKRLTIILFLTLKWISFIFLTCVMILNLEASVWALSTYMSTSNQIMTSFVAVANKAKKKKFFVSRYPRVLVKSPALNIQDFQFVFFVCVCKKNK